MDNLKDTKIVLLVTLSRIFLSPGRSPQGVFGLIPYSNKDQYSHDIMLTFGHSTVEHLRQLLIVSTFWMALENLGLLYVHIFGSITYLFNVMAGMKNI